MATIGGRLTSQIYYFGARRLRARGSLLFVIPPAMCYRVYTYAYACTRGGGREGGEWGAIGGKSGWKTLRRAELGNGRWSRVFYHAENRIDISFTVKTDWWIDRNCATDTRADYEYPPPPPVDWVGRPITGIRWKKKEKKEKRNEDASRINK